jgi:nickel/cobalt transporter (NiCoT) family protein
MTAPESWTGYAESALKSPLFPLAAVVGAINALALGDAACLALRFGSSVLVMGGLSFLLGLQHGFDADHIAAIDNVTRKLRQDGKQALSSGLWFAAGHSTVVLLVSAGLIVGVGVSQGALASLDRWGALVARLLTAGFLTLLGLINLQLFTRLRRALREDSLDNQTPGFAQAPWSGVFGFLYRRLDASWKMLPVGFLFGLSFDTATEVAMLGLSADAAARGRLPLWSVMIFPLLFTAGMIAVDAADGVVMMRVYEWAFSEPRRKLFFNTVITGLSAVMALAIAGLEWLQWTSLRFQLSGPLWEAVDNLDFAKIGVCMVGGLLLTWLLARRHYYRCFPLAAD